MDLTPAQRRMAFIVIVLALAGLGAFLPGDVVRICDLEGVEFARGIVRYPAAEVSSGHLARTEVVHRDDLVIL